MTCETRLNHRPHEPNDLVPDEANRSKARCHYEEQKRRHQNVVSRHQPNSAVRMRRLAGSFHRITSNSRPWQPDTSWQRRCWRTARNSGIIRADRCRF
jgi:hypothetical protein